MLVSLSTDRDQHEMPFPHRNFRSNLVQSTPNNSNLKAIRKTVRVIESSSYRELRTNVTHKKIIDILKREGKTWLNLYDPELHRQIFCNVKSENTRLPENKFKVLDYSTNFFFTYHNLANVVWVIKGKIVSKMTWLEMKIELSRVGVTAAKLQ